MSRYLLEFQTEEIPARFMENTIKSLKKAFSEKLKEEELDFEEIIVLGTYRRLSIFINGLSETSKDKEIELRGPKVSSAYDAAGNPTRALEGFLKGNKLDLEQIGQKEIKGDTYVYFKDVVKGLTAKELLPVMVNEVFHELHFPKMMRWGNNIFSFVRPIKSILSILDNEKLEVTFENITSGDVTRGHRFLSKGLITIKSIDEYEETLLNNYVILDQNKRKSKILSEIKAIEDQHEVNVPIDEELLTELTYLSEYPTPFLGTYKEEYLTLPKEVIILTMKLNQKYFIVEKKDGTIINKFIGVRCGTMEHMDQVIHGNEKVLKARLEDAIFFYNEDKKNRLLNNLEKLTKVIFQEKVGSIEFKTRRIKELGSYLNDDLQLNTKETIENVALLCKCDLESNMVKEFAKLQGIMGYYYGLNEGYSKNESLGIMEHYMPKSAKDQIPSTVEGKVVSIADKLDTVVAIFLCNLIPSGSQDPYGLRRMSHGICRIIIESNYDLDFSKLLDKSLSLFTGMDNLSDFLETRKLIVEFFKLRLINILEEEGIDKKVIGSVIGQSDLRNILSEYNNVKSLNKVLLECHLDEFLEPLKRVKNILKKQKNLNLLSVPDETLFVSQSEEELFICAKELIESSSNLDYEHSVNGLKELQVPLNNFFENIMVMDEDEKIRDNRLALLNYIQNHNDKFFNIDPFIGK